MFYEEFTERLGFATDRAYYEEHLEPLYNYGNLDKEQFVDFVRPAMRARFFKEEDAHEYLFLSEGSRARCGWYIGTYYKVVEHDVSIATGKVQYTLKALTPEDEEMLKSVDLHYSSSALLASDDRFEFTFVA